MCIVPLTDWVPKGVCAAMVREQSAVLLLWSGTVTAGSMAVRLGLSMAGRTLDLSLCQRILEEWVI